MKYLIAGCGYVGTHFAQHLLQNGHEVYALRRHVQTLLPLKEQGLHIIPASLLNPGSLENLPQVDRLLFCQAPSREMDSYEDIYYHGTQQLIQSLSQKSPEKIVFISSTSVYGDYQGSWVDESDDPSVATYCSAEAEQNAQILLGAEQCVLRSKIPSVVLRLGGIYGPDRNKLEMLRAGLAKVSLDSHYVNRIYITDIVRVLSLIFERAKTGEIYLGVDDNPSTQKEFYEWLAERTQVELPKDQAAPVEKGFGRRHGSNKRCLNKKLKNLGFKFEFPSFREGYDHILSLESKNRRER